VTKNYSINDVTRGHRGSVWMSVILLSMIYSILILHLTLLSMEITCHCAEREWQDDSAKDRCAPFPYSHE